MHRVLEEVERQELGHRPDRGRQGLELVALERQMLQLREYLSDVGCGSGLRVCSRRFAVYGVGMRVEVEGRGFGVWGVGCGVKGAGGGKRESDLGRKYNQVHL